ncbi:hypothetical protein PpBr36_01734, partial [Pyricularia pennisetigena]|uniref:hypothetical protein n=1 Tax=Pyricularia pennisetigena TaxID=1578925 RepID=UPI00114E0971
TTLCFKFQAQVRGRDSLTGKAPPRKDKGFSPSSQRSRCVEINRPSPIKTATAQARHPPCSLFIRPFSTYCY